MELFWLLATIGAALISIWMIWERQWQTARIPLFVTFAAAVMYVLRRYQRRKFDQGK
jgi:multisubunit Na+/H+ antiporter MnhE subunit